jgi:sec-independent protein translocase protein TatA
MLGDLFDSPWKILIIAAVVLILFGSRKMPDAARSLGRSMRILKAEMHDLHEEGADGAQAGQPDQQPQPQPQITTAASTPVVSVPMAPPDSVPAAPVAPPASVPYTHTPAAGFPAPPPAPPASVPVPAEVQQDTRPA